jgi:uncharacterized membrane-anchored protein YhcB (DUF1043 family)
MNALYILLQVEQVLPQFWQYGAIGLVAVIAIALYWIERKERIKIQEEKDKLYLEMSSNKKELERILEELKSL